MRGYFGRSQITAIGQITAVRPGVNEHSNYKPCLYFFIRSMTFIVRNRRPRLVVIITEGGFTRRPREPRGQNSIAATFHLSPKVLSRTNHEYSQRQECWLMAKS